MSSQGQQVTGYPHKDANNVWAVEPADPALFSQAPAYELSEEEIKKNARHVRNGDLIRLKHVKTESYLLTHDVASPLTPTHMEMTTIAASKHPERYNETIWKVEVDRLAANEKVSTHKHYIKIVNAIHKVAVHCHTGILPEWGFGQQEINGNKNMKEKGNLWFVESIEHPRIVNGTYFYNHLANITVPGTDIDEKPEVQKPKSSMSFFKKFLELQGLMISHNSGLTKSHPYSSNAASWPFVIRGISFWERKDGFKQIYLLGNPLIWWTCIMGTLMYAVMWVLDRVLLQRGIDEFGDSVRRWWNRSIGFLFVAWIAHWAPFFLMGRQLFLHHYLPSFIFSTMITALVFEFMGRVSNEVIVNMGLTLRQSIPVKVWMRSQGGLKYWGFLAILSSVFIGIFWFFSPLVYGSALESSAAVVSRKWLSSWDLQHAGN